jgi:hypothetical protein
MGSRRLAVAHGLFNALSGAWPLVNMKSFEAVTGPKTDDWLVRTVGLLLVANGVVQLGSRSPDELAQARRLGIGTAAAMAAIDIFYGGKGRIRRIYLADSVMELAWITAWLRSRPAQAGLTGGAARIDG